MRYFVIVAVFGFCATFVGEDLSAQEPKQAPTRAVRKEIKLERKITPKLQPITWTGPARSLLPAKGKGNWETIDFGSNGENFVTDGVMTIESGEMLSGMRLVDDDLPAKNYEITLETKRTDGIDFFCGLTFPVNQDHCCLIVAGWSGAVVGLSCIDDYDAGSKSNPTRQLIGFEDDQWYRIRLRVLENRIVAWIDDQCIIDQDIQGKKISLRGDTVSCRPLGLCTFQTTSLTRKMTIRQFTLKAGDAQANDGPTEKAAPTKSR